MHASFEKNFEFRILLLSISGSDHARESLAHAQFSSFGFHFMSPCLHEISTLDMKFHVCLFDRHEIRPDMKLMSGLSCKRYKASDLRQVWKNLMSPDMKPHVNTPVVNVKMKKKQKKTKSP